MGCQDPNPMESSSETDQVFRAELDRNSFFLLFIFYFLFYFNMLSCDKIDLGRTERSKLAVAVHFVSSRSTTVDTHGIFSLAVHSLASVEGKWTMRYFLNP